MFTNWTSKWVLLSIPGLIALYLTFGYSLERADFGRLLLLYAALFALSYLLLSLGRQSFWFLAGCGLLMRLLFIPALPNLSQDFYRFIWDGRLLLEGINPYLYTPTSLLEAPPVTWKAPELMQLLAQGMGDLSAGHFTSYPPLNQLFFALAALLGGKSVLGPVIAMRLLVILADLGILVFGARLLKGLELPVRGIFLYFLNPFVIIEFTGNLHFEAAMLFFILLALYQLRAGRWLWAAVLLGLSISVKLIPLLFLPLFYRYFVYTGLFSKGFWRLKYFFWVVIAVAAITFTPFYSEILLTNFFQTIALWFQSFEFNASIFYIIRWIGFQVNGWDPIATVGKILPVIVFAVVLLLAFLRENRRLPSLITSMLLAVSCYLFLSTTVHPWYIATPLLLSVFTPYRYVLVWSFTIVLSYSAYAGAKVAENPWLIALEYLVVLLVLFWELRKYRDTRLSWKISPDRP